MSKAAKISLVVVIALAGLFVLTDRVLAMVAADKLADRVAAELASKDITTSEKPDVSVHGFPFLTQVLRGEYESIQITSPDLTSDDVKFTDLNVNVDGIQAENFGLTPVLAKKVSGEGIVPYDSLAKLIPQSNVTVSAQGDKLKVNVPLSFAGQSIEVVAIVTPSVSDNRLRLSIEELTNDKGQSLPSAASLLLAPFNALLSGGFALPDLPYDLKVERVEVTNTGLRVWAAATDVPLN